MKKLYCFYAGSEFIASDDYSVLECSADKSWNSFLKEVHSRYYSQMKIVQLNFEGEHSEFSKQKSLYPSAKAHVFVLNSYQIITEDDIIQDLVNSEDIELAFQSLESKSVFIEKVNIIKKEIAAGRLYQANITAPLEATCDNPAESVFKKYFSLLNGQYKAFLPLNGELSVISFSPELFLQKAGSVLITRPIKGSLKSDLSFAEDLLADSKEEAELSMIVDLLRNDLNRIEAARNSVVTQHRAALQLGYIQHTFSEVQIETNKDLSEILECTLPGGSISGCPKLESLKVISELESYKRQIYTGSIGWWKENNFTLNLAIRTFIKYQSSIYYHAGCGIVYDSHAEKEWAEFILKTGKINAKF